MLLLLSSLAAAAQFSPSDDCIYDRTTAAERQAIGQAVLARRTRTVAELTQLATDQCARDHHWSVQQALNMNGYATMRSAAESIAGRLGKPDWSSSALRAIREWPVDRVRTLAGTGTDTGNAEFKRVLAQMIGADPSLPDAVKALDNANLESFVFMVKLNAVAELSRRGG
jgi:hypothetical protein